MDSFHSGFQACAKEVLKYLGTVEKWSSCEQRCTQLIEHLHKVLARLVQTQLGTQERDDQANCVPVIQRTQNPEANENDTDTDSGYGGEADKSDARAEKACDTVRVKIKQEFGDEHVAKKPRMNWSEKSSTGLSAEQPNLALMNSLMGMAGVGQHTPFCVPFYFINPSAAGSYMPFFDKSSLEKLVYPALSGPFPWLYPGITAHTSAATAASATAAAFPGGGPLEKNLGFGATSKEKDCSSPLNEVKQSNRVGASSPTDEEQNSDPDLNEVQIQMKESSTTG